MNHLEHNSDYFSRIKSDRLIDLFCKLVCIDSLSFQEREMADFIMQHLKEMGIQAEEDDAGSTIGGNAGNIFAEVPKIKSESDRLYSDGKSECKFNQAEKNTESCDDTPVLFVAHMDTVAPSIGKKAIVHPDGTITSDGTTVLGADDLAAIACILEAIKELQEEEIPHRKIELLFPVAEEAYTIGSSAFDYQKVTAKEAYALDCSDRIGSYSTQEPTLISFKITFKGRAAHAGFDPEKGIHTILAASRAIERMPIGRPNDHSTFNIGQISGGTQTNIVPDETTLLGELRSSIHEDALSLYEKAISICEEEAARIGASIEASKSVFLTAYHVNEEDISLTHYQRVLDDLGIQKSALSSFGGSDNNVLRRIGIPGICMASPMHKIHTTEEFTTVEEMVQCTAIVKKLMTITD